MERFCFTISDKKISESLYHAIKGKGAFSRFKDAIHRYGIAEDWCEENGIEYTED
jgi:hypothetical protein